MAFKMKGAPYKKAGKVGEFIKNNPVAAAGIGLGAAALLGRRRKKKKTEEEETKERVSF
jgi:LPXTG-motif cell wall-anchored protein